MLYLTCTMISTADLAHCGISLAKDWVSVYFGTRARMHCLVTGTCSLLVTIKSKCKGYPSMPNKMTSDIGMI